MELKQLSLFTEAPYVAGSATSKAAADALTRSGRATSLQAETLWLFVFYDGMGGLTDEKLDQVARDARLVFANTLRPRRIALTKKGYLEDSGKKRLTNAMQEAVVWRVTEAGRTAHREQTAEVELEDGR